MKTSFTTLWLLLCCASGLPLPGRCAPAVDALCVVPPALHAELEAAATAGTANPLGTEAALAPFRALRARHPDDIFAHEGYQDAVRRYGVEGHLKALTEEYQSLDARHDGIQMYHYLYLRFLVGYSTGAAIQGLTEMAAQDPDFTPAHQTLAGIYATTTFRDASKEEHERAKLLSLCPKAMPDALPPPLPGPSLLLDQAERLLARHGDPAHILAMTTEGITRDEWRWQHIHPHDSYSGDEKRAALLALRAGYWEAWGIQVRCYRRMNRPNEADALLARMDRSAASFQSEPGRSYWDALAALVPLYAEGGHKEEASRELDLMTTLLAKRPNPEGDAQVKALTALITDTPHAK